MKAKDIKGTRFFHLSAPCPTGWWYPTKDTVRIGRMMIESCIFILYEIEDGQLRLTGKSLSIAKSGKRKPDRRIYTRSREVQEDVLRTDCRLSAKGGREVGSHAEESRILDGVADRQ